MAYCILCSVNFSIASSGLYDIKRDASSAHHIKAEIVNNLAKRFPNIVRESDVDSLVEKFQDFQLASKDELPCLDLNVDIFWSKMSDLNKHLDPQNAFQTYAILQKHVWYSLLAMQR